jgi:glycosyltransferase involved in cell wall biosynthesis
MTTAQVTVAVPSFNQGQYLEEALTSIFSQDVPVEVFVMDGGSTDGSLETIRKWAPHLAGWRSHPDAGQAAAINEGIALGSAPYVAWLNSDDFYLPEGLLKLISALEANSGCPASYGRAWHHTEPDGKRRPVWVRPFSEAWLAQACFICQPATLIRRSAWETVGGVDASLHMALDYDLWWRLYKTFEPLAFVDDYVAVNREHPETKTHTRRRDHYREAMAVVKKHHGRIPIKWWLAQPYSVWFRGIA